MPGYEGAQSDEQQKPRELSGDHRTGLAKLPMVIEWLINKLGHGHDSAPARSAVLPLPSADAMQCKSIDTNRLDLNFIQDFNTTAFGVHLSLI